MGAEVALSVPDALKSVPASVPTFPLDPGQCDRAGSGLQAITIGYSGDSGLFPHRLEQVLDAREAAR